MLNSEEQENMKGPLALRLWLLQQEDNILDKLSQKEEEN
jgi:hypothetical protein